MVVVVVGWLVGWLVVVGWLVGVLWLVRCGRLVEVTWVA